jgi:hypothetical protein
MNSRFARLEEVPGNTLMKRKRFLKLARIITTTTALLLAMAGLVLVAPSPAQAGDTYYPCQAMISTVSPGTTYYSQSISCAIKPACGESWGQLYRVEWHMTVSSGGVTVKYLRLTVTHTQGEDITIGAKAMIGANKTYSFGAWNQVPPHQSSWSINYDVKPDTYFTKRSDGTVEFMFVRSSSKANGCNDGWTTLRYQLKIV